MSRSASSLAGVLTLLLAGCEIPPPEYQFGFNLTGLTLELYSDDVGVHPHLDVLVDPNNPFAEYGVGAETKWDILAQGGNVGGFYAWATVLANEPTGEAQFYTAIKLRDIYTVGEVSQEDLPRVRNLALRGFQAVLDAFPESVTYDATGTISARLATFAYNEITALGGRVQGDWVLVQTPSGGTEAVRSAPQDPPRAADGGG
jgi:hypothetical protein